MNNSSLRGSRRCVTGSTATLGLDVATLPHADGAGHLGVG